ncbi:MAG: hypothetical protein N2Z70_00045 [Bdellovibrionaceae bacterium]|nr:hypothetical protein [Pseudobdellovibrionaceae bacterium]
MKSNLKNTLKTIGLLGTIAALAFSYQNCGRSAINGTSDMSSFAAMDVTENELFTRLQNGEATQAELSYALSRYQNLLDTQISAANSVGSISGSNNQVSIGEAIRSIAEAISQNVREIRNLLFQQRLASNSPEVLKKYTELVDLLARARDLNNFLILKSDIGEVRADLEDTKRQVLQLRQDVNALQNSLREVREQIIPQLRAELTQRLNQLGQRLDQEVSARQAQIADLNQQISAERDARQREILTLRRDMEQGLAQLRSELLNKIRETREDLQLNIDAVRAIANSNLTRINELRESVIVLTLQLQQTTQQLNSLSQRVESDISNIQNELQQIRTAGNENYQQMVQAWSCEEDMVIREGAQMFGVAQLPGLGVSVSEACVRSKEQVLYSVCVARYPTFCGACQGHTRPQDCSHWQNMSGKDRLEILLNMRQEIAINYLAKQSELHARAIYGGNQCRPECLTGLSDPNVQQILGLIQNQSQSSSNGSAANCPNEPWKHCGLYGVTYSLALNDVALATRINEVSGNLSRQIASLRADFEEEKRSVAQRFQLTEQELNQQINRLKQTTESRFMDIARSMAGLASASGQEIANQVSQRSAELAAVGAERAAKTDLLTNAIAAAMGYSVDLTRAQLADRHTELATLLARGMAVSSFDIITEVFKTLNPNQNNRPFYDVEFGQQVGPQCQGQVRQTPFTNIVGRDTHEILAIAYLRALVGGIRSSNAQNNSIFFNHQGVVSSNSFQQALLARIFDYRLDPAQQVNVACLNAIDQFARNMLLNDSRFAAHRTQLSQNATLERLASLLVKDAKDVFAKLGALHTLILASTASGRDTSDARLAEIVNRLVDLAVTERRHALLNNEVEDLIAIQRDLSIQNGFQNQFQAYLAQFRDNMAAMNTGLANVRTQLQNEIATRQQQNAAMANQINQLRDAMGYVAALAMTDPLASPELRQRVQAAANIDQNIHNLIQQINNSGRNQIEEPFTPRLLAVRHVTQGNATCFGTMNSVANLPNGNAFVGHWGITSGNNIWSDQCMFNFRQGSQHKDNVLYRIWGSAHKIEFKSTINASVVRTIDFRGPASNSFPIRRIVDGNHRQGVFDAQVPGILDPAVQRGYAYQEGIISLTPIYVANSGAETRGTAQTYSMTLYSPVVLDFVSRGLPQTISSTESMIQFDLAQLGFKQQIGWIKETEHVGLLALDLNGNSRIDHGGELFGEFMTLHRTGEYAPNGYAALAQYDENRDGEINEKDPIFSRLIVWFDRNHNGVSEKDELVSLSQAHVTRISVKYDELPASKQWNNGNQIRYQAKFYGPSTCPAQGCNSYDIYFGTAWKSQIPMALAK